MTVATKKWLYGLSAGFIGGGAAAVSSGIAMKLIEPMHTGWHVIKIMLCIFVITGLTHAFAYLSKSPLPDWDTETERRTPPEMTVKQISPTEAQVTVAPSSPPSIPATGNKP